MAAASDRTLQHINPVLNVADLQASIGFYTGLGFSLLDTYGDPADFAIIRWGEHEIYLCQGSQGQPGTWLALFISNAADLYDQLVAEGVTVLMPPTESGAEYRIKDPDNHVLRIFPG